eukprot:jgi/Botrbrau1/1828/Bobra.146_1s0024.1
MTGISVTKFAIMLLLGPASPVLCIRPGTWQGFLKRKARNLAQSGPDVLGFLFPPVQQGDNGITYVQRNISAFNSGFQNIIYVQNLANGSGTTVDVGYRNNFTVTNPINNDQYKATDSYHVGGNGGNSSLNVNGGRYNDAEWTGSTGDNIYKGAFFDFWNVGTSGPVWTGSSNTSLGNTTWSYPFAHGPFTTNEGVPSPSLVPLG